MRRSAAGKPVTDSVCVSALGSGPALPFAHAAGLLVAVAVAVAASLLSELRGLALPAGFPAHGVLAPAVAGHVPVVGGSVLANAAKRVARPMARNNGSTSSPAVPITAASSGGRKGTCFLLEQRHGRIPVANLGQAGQEKHFRDIEPDAQIEYVTQVIH